MSAKLNSGDSSCSSSMSMCSSIIAQVNCIEYIMQATTGKINLQFFDVNGDTLNLDDYVEIQILLFDELECGLANFWYPVVPTGESGFLIDIIQESVTGNITNEGLVTISISKECSSISPGDIFAEVVLTDVDGNITGIPCFLVAKIRESRIYNNNGTHCG